MFSAAVMLKRMGGVFIILYVKIFGFMVNVRAGMVKKYGAWIARIGSGYR